MSRSITYNQELREEYLQLFTNCNLNSKYAHLGNRTADRILSQQTRYKSVSGITSVPWHVIAVIHAMESNLNFNCHLHNGDSIHSKTTRIPANRPPGEPPFTWEESAVDALRLEGLTGWSDWSLPSTLFKLEAYSWSSMAWSAP